MGVNLLPHCPSGGITAMDMAILRGGDFLYLASEKQKKKVNQGDRKPLGLYNGTGPSRSAWHLTELKAR